MKKHQVLLEDGGPYAFVQEVQHIRPYKLLAALETEGEDRIAHIRLSKRRGLEMGVVDETPRPGVADYSLQYLETALVVAVMKITDARRVLEFGTHLGLTTLNIALNLPSDGLVVTMDLMPRNRFKEWRGFSAARKIYALCETDSTTYDFAKLTEGGLFDFIWIDGNPDRWPDTVNAFKLVTRGKLSCIGWHDYGAEGANTTHVVEALASSGETIYHIEDTKVCLWFSKPMPGLA